MKLHPDKCFMGMKSRILLKPVVSRKGLEVDTNKVKAILALLATTCVKEVQGYLGYVRYYGRFIESYAKQAIPLIELLKKEEEVIWTERRQKAFEELKKTLVKAPVLSPTGWSLEFHITIDASGWCLGTILWQYKGDKRKCLVYYASR